MYYYLQSHSCSPSFYSPGLLLMSRSAFFNLDTTDALGWKILCYRGLSCALWNIYTHLWPLPTRCQYHPNPSPPSCVNQKCCQTFTNIPWGIKMPPVETTGLEQLEIIFFPPPDCMVFPSAWDSSSFLSTLHWFLLLHSLPKRLLH